MFVLGASFLFLIHQRFTFSIPRSWSRERRSVHITNVGILAMIAGGWLTIGLPTFFLIHVPIVVLAAAIGSWLFFVQHQFEDAYWQPHESWDFTRSALEGSSYYRLPRVLQWFTGNIGFHHIHHFDSRIPNYNLPDCYAAEPAFQQAITLGNSRQPQVHQVEALGRAASADGNLCRSSRRRSANGPQSWPRNEFLH